MCCFRISAETSALNNANLLIRLSRGIGFHFLNSLHGILGYVRDVHCVSGNVSLGRGEKSSTVFYSVGFGQT